MEVIKTFLFYHKRDNWRGVRGAGRGRRARQVKVRARPPLVVGGREWCRELDVRFASLNGCTSQGKTRQTRRISDRGCRIREKGRVMGRI